MKGTHETQNSCHHPVRALTEMRTDSGVRMRPKIRAITRFASELLTLNSELLTLNSEPVPRSPQSIILVGGGSGQKKKEAGASSKSYSKSLKLYCTKT